MTYYTCDECEWAGPFDDARSHYEDTGHDAFSRRDQTEASGKSVEHHYHFSYPQYCNHVFTWMGTMPPTHCPKCGLQLRAYTWPQYNYPNTYGTINANGSGGGTVKWGGTSGVDGTAGSIAKL